MEVNVRELCAGEVNIFKVDVGEGAVVEAKIEANLISSRGRIKGDIVAKSRVELFSTARVDGDITTPDLVVESGCRFNGLCRMNDER